LAVLLLLMLLLLHMLVGVVGERRGMLLLLLLLMVSGERAEMWWEEVGMMVNTLAGQLPGQQLRLQASKKKDSTNNFPTKIFFLSERKVQISRKIKKVQFFFL
jgi:hypothetical protein